MKLNDLSFKELNATLKHINEYFIQSNSPCLFNHIDLGNNENLSRENWVKFFKTITELGKERISVEIINEFFEDEMHEEDN